MPKIGAGELLVKIIASGICGTDVMEWYRIKKAPRVLGHEIAGVIVESKSSRFKVGQRVFVSHHVPCNKCKYCTSYNQTACETLHSGNYDPGGFSEFVRIPKINVEYGTYLLPKNVSFEEGTMIEPLACVVSGQKLIGIAKEQTVLVLGAGVSGLLNIRLAKLKKAKVTAVDIDEYRMKKAREAGADEVLNANQDIRLKADRIIICTGAYSAISQAFSLIDRKGIILLFAIPQKNIEIPNEEFWRNELTLVSSYGAAPDDLEEAIKLIKNRKADVKKMITHKVGLPDIKTGFRIVSEAKNSLKVVIEPHRA